MNIKKCVSLLLSLIIGASMLMGCNDSKNEVLNIVETDMIKLINDDFIIDNGILKVVIKKSNGYIKSVENKILNKNLKPDNGSWPFSLEYGYDRNIVSINEKSSNVVTKAETVKGDGEILKITYNDLVTDKGKASTGIKATVNYRIQKDTNYIMISTDFDLTSVPAVGDKNRENGIYALKMLDGAQFETKDSRLTAPTWNGGTYWKNIETNSEFTKPNGATLAYPGKDNVSLEAGWLDLSNSSGGLGIGLINRLEMPTEFRIVANKTKKTVTFNNVQFEPNSIIGRSVPLVKGDKFSGDEMLVVAHNADWHSTADAYRTEYQKAFVTENGEADYLTNETMSKKAVNLDYMTRGFGKLYGQSSNKFSEMTESTKNLMAEINGDIKRSTFWLAGQNTLGYAYDVPFMTPTHPESGGDAGLKKMANDFKALNSSLFVYEHPFAVDPDRKEIKEILSKVDPKQHTEYWDGCNHRSVCIDNEIMYNMWKDEILPPQVALDVNGFQLDQCPLQQTVCDLSGHNHGLTAVERLSSHSKGVNNLQKLIRASIDDCFLVSEARSDILSRYVDIFQQCWHHTRLWDGYWEYGAGQYTHPYVVYQPSSIGEFYNIDTKKYDSGVNMMLQGALYGGIMCISDGGSVEIKKEFTRFKKEYRDGKMPGYPFGFKDNVGVSVSNPDLDVRIFKENNKITAVFLTNYHVTDAKVSIDLNKLGLKGNYELSVTENMGKLGYVVIDADKI